MSQIATREHVDVICPGLVAGVPTRRLIATIQPADEGKGLETKYVDRTQRDDYDHYATRPIGIKTGAKPTIWAADEPIKFMEHLQFFYKDKLVRFSAPHTEEDCPFRKAKRHILWDEPPPVSHKEKRVINRKGVEMAEHVCIMVYSWVGGKPKTQRIASAGMADGTLVIEHAQRTQRRDLDPLITESLSVSGKTSDPKKRPLEHLAMLEVCFGPDSGLLTVCTDPHDPDRCPFKKSDTIAGKWWGREVGEFAPMHGGAVHVDVFRGSDEAGYDRVGNFDIGHHHLRTRVYDPTWHSRVLEIARSPILSQYVQRATTHEDPMGLFLAIGRAIQAFEWDLTATPAHRPTHCPFKDAEHLGRVLMSEEAIHDVA